MTKPRVEPQWSRVWQPREQSGRCETQQDISPHSAVRRMLALSQPLATVSKLKIEAGAGVRAEPNCPPLRSIKTVDKACVVRITPMRTATMRPQSPSCAKVEAVSVRHYAFGRRELSGFEEIDARAAVMVNLNSLAPGFLLGV